MDPQVEVLDASSVDATAAPAGVVAVVAAKHPIHQVLRTCGVTTLEFYLRLYRKPY